MATLFCLSHPPSSDPYQGELLDLATEGDGVILIEDGVYAAGSNANPLSAALAAAQARGVRLWALQADLEARGVTTALPVVDYPGFVGLIIEHDRCVH